MPIINLSAPWTILYQQINAMFKQDKDVKVVLDEKKHTIKLYVEDEEKADALGYLLNQAKTFGNTPVEVSVVPANETLKDEVRNMQKVFEKAFTGNPAMDYAANYSTAFGSFTFVVFANEVVQYFCDNMFDVNGVKSTLYEDIAREIFPKHITQSGVYFCTNTPNW